MENYNIYKDIAERTNGDVYLGVVGPVRTGKSTFIKRFMDLLVIPNIENNYTKERAKDELPQSASGRTIMTTEPKFVPNEAVAVNLGDNIDVKVRLIDCVGYIVEGAEGQFDGVQPRMVSTPWSDTPMPFASAAEIGTKKVINDHSTIGIVVTTDGSITDIPRENYIEAEQRVISELKAIKKPFVVILNSVRPYSQETESLKDELSKNYAVPVIPLNIAQLKQEDINNIMESVLYEFPVSEISFNMPRWVESLANDHWIKKELIDTAKEIMTSVDKIRSIKDCVFMMSENPYVKKAFVENIAMGEGVAKVEVTMEDELFYKVLSETIGTEINNDYELVSTIKTLSEVKKEYDKIESAISDVRRKGYGIVSPQFEDIKLDKPEMFKQGQRYGMKLKARGEAIHLIRTDVNAEVSPIVGTEEQSKLYIDEVIKEYETNPEKVWALNIFGRTLDNLVNEGMSNKIYRMPEDAQEKVQETLQKIVNEGSGGLICIIL